jgi:hypothetical protein
MSRESVGKIDISNPAFRALRQDLFLYHRHAIMGIKIACISVNR